MLSESISEIKSDAFVRRPKQKGNKTATTTDVHISIKTLKIPSQKRKRRRTFFKIRSKSFIIVGNKWISPTCFDRATGHLVKSRARKERKKEKNDGSGGRARRRCKWLIYTTAMHMFSRVAVCECVCVCIESARPS